MLVDHPDSVRRPSGSANSGTTGAPVRSASAATAEVVAAGRLKKSTWIASRLEDVLIDQHRDALGLPAARACTRRIVPCR